MDFPESGGGENFLVAAGDAQAMAHIFAGILQIHGVEMIAHADALIELAHVAPPEQRAEFGLADENDLDELVGLGFEVGKEPDLFQHRRIEMLGLVDDQDHGPPFPPLPQQKFVEQMEQIPGFGGRAFDGELPLDRPQQIEGADAGIEDESQAIAVVVQIFEQRPQHRGLAGADLAGDGDETAAILDPVEQMGENFPMIPAQIDEPGIRCEGERFFLKAVKIQIHESVRKLRDRGGRGTPVNSPTAEALFQDQSHSGTIGKSWRRRHFLLGL